MVGSIVVTMQKGISAMIFHVRRLIERPSRPYLTGSAA